MTTYHTHTLDNGLRLIVEAIPSSPMAIMNIMYKVGARNEAPHKTGMAHLLEHVMFGGSKNIPSYDAVLEKVGGQNNAYTTNDVTNYWAMLPASKIEVAFWLESDRLLAPAYTVETIMTQRKVVLEEFKQVCLDRPYGDAWHELLQTAYQVHPYQWPTIGKNLAQIEGMKREEIIAFGERFYVPSNAVLVVVGNVDPKKIIEMAEKWFGSLPNKSLCTEKIPQEPPQKTARYQYVQRDVPQEALYKAYKIPPRTHPDYSSLHLLATYLATGDASLLHKVLVEEKGLLSEVEAYTTDFIDEGLFVIEGKLQQGKTFEAVEEALRGCLESVCEQVISSTALHKIRNQQRTQYVLEQATPIERAEMLAMATILGNTAFFQKEMEKICHIPATMLQETAKRYFREETSTTLCYAKQSRGSNL